MTRILAIDPGLTTGWACLTLTVYGDDQFDSGQIENRHTFERFFDGFTDNRGGGDLAVVCERFTITGDTARKSPQLDPLYIIGYMDGRCSRLGIPFILQLPSEAMSFADDAKLKRVGWWNPGCGHANDAARHLLTWLVKQRGPKANEMLLRLAETA